MFMFTKVVKLSNFFFFGGVWRLLQTSELVSDFLLYFKWKF
jgi:hypothetical protein